MIIQTYNQLPKVNAVVKATTNKVLSVCMVGVSETTPNVALSVGTP